MYYYRIRGIFSTALTKLILDAGHCISKPSMRIKNRFLDLSCDVKNPPDAYILDNDMKTGFFCRGDVNAVNALESVIKNTLEIPFIIKPFLNPNTIIKAKVIDLKPQHVLLTLGKGCKGILPSRSKHSFRVGDEMLACVKRQRTPASNVFEVSSSLNLVGKGVTLITDRQKPIFSKFLDKNRRIQLRDLEIAFEDLPFPCTVRWRSAAQDVPITTLQDEIKQLKTMLKEILNNAQNVPVGTILYEGTGDIQVFLSSVDKNNLDGVRREIIPTVMGHHVWKGLNPPIADFIAYMETVLAMDSSLERLLFASFKDFILEKIKNGGSLMIYHWKPTGQYYKLGPFQVEKITSEFVVLKRIVRTHGKYDGLNVKKEPGDVIITLVPKNGEWWIKHSYFSSEGILKGEYYNINTPPEFAFNNIRYFDLIVDVVNKPDTGPEVIDVVELNHLVEMHLISSKLKEKILQISEDLKKQAMLSDAQVIDDFKFKSWSW